MKNNKKLNSIATMSKEELKEINGGMYLMKRYPDIFPEGIPVDFYKNSIAMFNQRVGVRSSEMMNQGMIR